MGFEIAHSSLFGKDQRWYNENKNECIDFTFSKEGDHLIETIEPGKEKKCINGVRAARKVWLNYRDGVADVTSVAIENARAPLRKQGCIATYWIHDVSPGKTMEVWYNASTQICKSISWDNATLDNVKILDRDPRLGKNPAPTYNVNM